MLRKAVAVYLMFVTLAGPWLCCCSVTHHPTGRIPASTPEPVRSCCAHKPAHRPAGPAKDTRDSAPQGDPSGCPCKGDPNRGNALPEAVAKASSLVFAFGEYPVLLCVDLASASTPGTDLLVGRGRNALPFLSADDLLYAHHLLRC